MFDETTPVKACGDLAFNVSYSGKNFTLDFNLKGRWFFVISNVEKWVSDDRNKKSEESRETQSQAKRRRMLQFTAQDMETSLCNEDLSSRFLKAHVSDMLFLVYGCKNSDRLQSNMSIL